MKPSVLISRLAVLFIAGVSAVSSQTLELQPMDRQPTPVIDPASDDATLAIQRFSLPQGMQAKLWAAEPMLANPVAFDFDEKGRLFVSETYRYRSSVLDIRDYMGMLELDLAARTIEDRVALHHKVFGAQAKDFAIEGEVVRLVEDTERRRRGRQEPRVRRRVQHASSTASPRACSRATARCGSPTSPASGC